MIPLAGMEVPIWLLVWGACMFPVVVSLILTLDWRDARWRRGMGAWHALIVVAFILLAPLVVVFWILTFLVNIWERLMERLWA